jgi:Arc/MetJ-type ribon-helix-helix transcriptional regulator
MGQRPSSSVHQDRIRTHVVLSRHAVEAIDRLVGKRGRSEFIDEAVKQRVRQQQFLRALAHTAGAIRDEDHPEFADVPEFVRRLRQDDDRTAGRT